MFFRPITLTNRSACRHRALLLLLCCLAGAGLAQRGLEDVIVETYYVSDAGDTLLPAVSGRLAPGSVTYRIYLDLKPEYRLYAVYGKQGHELRLETSGRFFNNEDAGQRMANTVPRRSLSRNTVMLDSWLSVGAAAEDCYGVLKAEDDTLETVQHEKTFLSARNKRAGIPVHRRDGLRPADKVPFPLLYGPDSLFHVFYNSTVGSGLVTSNGAWACPGGAVGPDSLGTNRLLIAQLTTNGDLTFELNLQIGKRFQAPELYVARNPVGDEIAMPCLLGRMPSGTRVQAAGATTRERTDRSQVQHNTTKKTQ